MGVVTMKKNSLFTALSVMLALAFILSLFTVPSFARRRMGDINNDGKIGSDDARLALRASVQLETLNAEQTLAADMDADHFVTSGDARTILRISVNLDPMPDAFVDVPEDPADPATPTDATPTDATPTDPTKPTDPATPTDATPTDATPTDATGGIIPPAENNEFDMLRKGTFYFIATAVDGSGKSQMEIAKTANSEYLATTLNSISIAVLTIGDKYYLVNPKDNTYLDLNNIIVRSEMKLLGLNVDDLSHMNVFDFSFFPPLDQATRCETDSNGYVKYIFETEIGSLNVVMDGKTLLRIENAQDGSVYRIDFTKVTDEVPPEKCSINKKNERTQLIFLTSLMNTGN